MKKAFLLLLFAVSCAPAPSGNLTNVRMAVGGQAQFIYLPLTLADQLGYYKDAGLSVSISDLKGGSEALAALIGGSVDMVTGFYEHTVRAQAQGKELKMVALFDRYPGLVLMVGKNHIDQVHSIGDLVGHPVGITAPGSSTDQMLKLILRSNNLEPQAIPVVTAGTTAMLAALEQDRIWAGITVDPLATKLQNDKTAQVLYDTRTQHGTEQVFGGPWPAGGIYSSAEFIGKNPQTVRAVVGAAVRALNYLQTHSADEVASHMPESFWAGGREQYIQSLKANLEMFSADGTMPPAGPANVLKTLGLVDPQIAAAKIDLSRTFDSSFLTASPQ